MSTVPSPLSIRIQAKRPPNASNTGSIVSLLSVDPSVAASGLLTVAASAPTSETKLSVIHDDPTHPTELTIHLAQPSSAGFLDLCTPILWTSASVCETQVSIGSTPSWLFVEGSGDGASWNATGPLSRDAADKLAIFTCASSTCDALSEHRILMVFGDTTTAWLDAEDFPSSGAAGIQADSPLAGNHACERVDPRGDPLVCGCH